MAKVAEKRNGVPLSQVQHLWELKKEIEDLQREYKLLADELKDKADELGIERFPGVTVDAVISDRVETEVNMKKALAHLMNLPKPEQYLRLDLTKAKKDFGEAVVDSFSKKVLVKAAMLRWEVRK